VRPVYLVKGSDPSLVADAVRALIAELVGDDDPGLMVEDRTVDPDDETVVAAVLDACLTPPFLSARRIVVARNAAALRADGAARLVEYLAQPLETSVLVLVQTGGTLSQKLAAAVKQAGEVRDAGVPTGKARSSWLVGRLRSGPVKLDAAAGALLGEHLGEDMGRLTGILATLGAAYGEGAVIGVAEVEPFIGKAGAVAPWDLTDAIDAGRTEVALVHLHRMIEAGERHPLVVMATLHRHYAAMLRLDGSGARSDADAAKVLGMKSAFPAKKALTQSRKLGASGVRRAIALLSEADLDLRGAKEWPDELVLEVLVARLCRLVPSRR